MSRATSVTLGYAEKQLHPRSLLRDQLPSKLGGHPAWLRPNELPSCTDVQCGECKQPLEFILQIYAPLPSHPHIHRMLYIFVCQNGLCLPKPGGMCVLRSELNTNSSMYPTFADEPLDEVEGIPEVDFGFASTCIVCGCGGDKVCSGCHEVYYCTKTHQRRHWKAGHREECGSKPVNIPESVQRLSLRQWEIVTESEYLCFDSKSDIDKVKSYNAKIRGMGDRELEELKRLEFDAEDVEEDEYFELFKKIIDENPEQCLRYARGGEPLWMGSYSQTTLEDVGCCRRCGGSMCFEFQVLPQCLHYLGVDSWNAERGRDIDWGSLCIYTCESNCAINGPFTKELIWFQPSPSMIQ